MKTDKQNIENRLFDDLANKGLNDYSVSEVEIDALNKKLIIKKRGVNNKIFYSLIIVAIFSFCFIWYINKSKTNKVKSESVAQKILTTNKRIADSIVKINQTEDNIIIAEEIKDINRSDESTMVEVKFKPLPMIKRNIEISNSENVSNSNLISYNVFVKRINRYLVVDYIKAGRYKNNKEQSFLYQFDKKGEDEIRNEKIDIEAQLIKAINYLEKSDYASCIKNLNIIEEFFKEDLNVKFYKSFCSFKLGDYELAFVGFNDCVNHKYNVFKEEADYYAALCLFGSGNVSEGKERLKDIINSKGVYSQMALNYMKAFDGK